MKYILNPHIALRSWWLVPYAYYWKGVRNALGLTRGEYELLSQCDGMCDIKDSDLLDSLVSRYLCHPWKEGEYLEEWQKPLVCDNRYFPAMNWMITGKCNYNCLHCFNAADNARIMNEWTLEDANRLLDEAQKCGINAFTITGGEPMLHKNFFKIIEGIYKRGMFVEELNTNGYYMTQDTLDRFREIGCFPLIKISFDGIGHHDWLRNYKGAQENTLRAIVLCVSNGFRVKVQTNVWKGNEDTLLQTAEYMDEVGVEEMRIIRTSEAPRWIQNAGNACLSITEYYDEMLRFVGEYGKREHHMSVDAWQFLRVFPQNRSYQVHPVECGADEYRDSLPVCRGNRGMVALGANGNVYPCHQMSGIYDSMQQCLGNTKESGLQTILQESDYLKEVCTTVKQLTEENKKCRECSFLKYCCGGCRALGLIFTGEKLGQDLSKCIFFEKHYLEKIEAALEGLTNCSPCS